MKPEIKSALTAQRDAIATKLRNVMPDNPETEETQYERGYKDARNFLAQLVESFPIESE